MSGHQYNSVLRSGLTRRLWLIIAFAMLVPVSLALVSHWLEAEERRASLQNQELTALSRDKASSLLFNARKVPGDFMRDLDGRYLVVLDGTGAARYTNAPVPEELVQLFAHRSPHAVDAPSSTTILAWYASGREWRGAMTWLPPAITSDLASANTVVVFAPEASFGATAGKLAPMAIGLIALSILVAFAVAALISERYLPPLRALQRGLIRLRERKFESLPRGLVSEFSPLEREFNTTSLSLSRDWRAFEVLGEVDRALLAASEIDRALDIVLPKFRELTRCPMRGRDPARSHRALARPAVHGGAGRGRTARAARQLRSGDDRHGARSARGPDHRAHRRGQAFLPHLHARRGRGILLAVAGARRRAPLGHAGGGLSRRAGAGSRGGRLRRGLRRAPARRAVQQRAR